MSIEDIRAKAIAKAQAAAKKEEKKQKRKAVRINRTSSRPQQAAPKKAVRISVPGVSSDRVNTILAKAKAKLTKKSKSRTNAELRKVKPANREPDFRITYDFIMDVYQKIGAKPMRAVYWYEYPLLRRDWTNEDRTELTPLAALCLLRFENLPDQEGVAPYQVRHSQFILEPSHRWVAGSVAQLLSTLYKGLDCSYLLGFKAGFDGNKKWDRLESMSLRYKRGFEDGHKILEQMLEKGLVSKEGSLDDENDPYEDEHDEKALTELHRVRGYTREGFEPYSKHNTIPSEEEQRKSALNKVFKNGEIR